MTVDCVACIRGGGRELTYARRLGEDAPKHPCNRCGKLFRTLPGLKYHTEQQVCKRRELRAAGRESDSSSEGAEERQDGQAPSSGSESATLSSRRHSVKRQRSRPVSSSASVPKKPKRQRRANIVSDSASSSESDSSGSGKRSVSRSNSSAVVAHSDSPFPNRVPFAAPESPSSSRSPAAPDAPGGVPDAPGSPVAPGSPGAPRALATAKLVRASSTIDRPRRSAAPIKTLAESDGPDGSSSSASLSSSSESSSESESVTDSSSDGVPRSGDAGKRPLAKAALSASERGEDAPAAIASARAMDKPGEDDDDTCDLWDPEACYRPVQFAPVFSSRTRPSIRLTRVGGSLVYEDAGAVQRVLHDAQPGLAAAAGMLAALQPIVERASADSAASRLADTLKSASAAARATRASSGGGLAALQAFAECSGAAVHKLRLRAADTGRSSIRLGAYQKGEHNLSPDSGWDGVALGSDPLAPGSAQCLCCPPSDGASAPPRRSPDVAFNCGGPVTALAFSRESVDGRALLAVGLAPSFERFDVLGAIEDADRGDSMVQLWALSSTPHDGGGAGLAALAYVVQMPQFGSVREMAWLPGSASPARLGLLALCSSAESVTLLSMPRPGAGASAPLYHGAELLVFSHSFARGTSALCLAWGGLRGSNTERLLCGLTDGTVAALCSAALGGEPAGAVTRFVPPLKALIEGRDGPAATAAAIAVTAICVCEDDPYVFATTGNDFNVRIWDLRQPMRELRHITIGLHLWFRKTRLLWPAGANYLYVGDEGGRAYCLGVADGLVSAIPLCHRSNITCMRASPRFPQLAGSVAADGTAVLLALPGSAKEAGKGVPARMLAAVRLGPSPRHEPKPPAHLPAALGQADVPAALTPDATPNERACPIVLTRDCLVAGVPRSFGDMAPDNSSDLRLNPLVPCPLSLYISAIDFGPGAPQPSATEWVATAAKYLGLVRCQLICLQVEATSGVDLASAAPLEPAGLEQQPDIGISATTSAVRPCKCGSLTHTRISHRDCPLKKS